MSEAAHLSPEQLDDVVARTAGGSPMSVSADDPAAAHLAGCPDCTAAVRTQLAVRSLLASGPDPGPMPADVAARLDAALAAAATTAAATADSTATTPDGAAAAASAPTGTVLPMQPARERRLARLSPKAARVGKILVGVAAAALIAGGGYAALHTTPRSSTASAAKSSSSGGSAAGSDSAPQASRPLQIQATGTAYTKANIVAKVTNLLAGGDAGSARPAPNAAIESTLTTPAGLHACLVALDAGSVQPLLVDLATFDGKPVAVLVLPAPAGSTAREVWVVSRDCAGGGTKDGTTYFATLP